MCYHNHLADFVESHVPTLFSDHFLAACNRVFVAHSCGKY